MVCQEVYDRVQSEDVLEIDVKQGSVKNLRTKEQFTATKLPEHVMNILAAGGLIGLLKQS
jgi:3-isopropylmalate/(R)-2-methylmalate dehydratase small subunit